jgi:hypothetical protein
MERKRARAGKRARRKPTRTSVRAPRVRPGPIPDLPEPGSGVQPTTVAVEATRTGVVPWQVRDAPEEIPGPEGEKLQIGDPDVSPLLNEYSGEEAPGASTPTPDQNVIDDIGRAYGLEEEDSNILRSSSEILDKRDRHRQD